MAPARRIEGFGVFLSAGPGRAVSCCREFLRRRDPGVRTRQRAEGGKPEGWPCNVPRATLGVPLRPRQVPSPPRCPRTPRCTPRKFGEAFLLLLTDRIRYHWRWWRWPRKRRLYWRGWLRGWRRRRVAVRPRSLPPTAATAPHPARRVPVAGACEGGKEKRNGRDSSGRRHKGQPALRPAFRPPGLSLLLPYEPRSPVLVLPLFRAAEFCAGIRIRGRIKTPTHPQIGIYCTQTMSSLLFSSIVVSPWNQQHGLSEKDSDIVLSSAIMSSLITLCWNILILSVHFSTQI